MRLKFNEGIEIETSGPLRLHHERDGWHVVGNGLMTAATTYKLSGNVAVAHSGPLVSISMPSEFSATRWVIRGLPMRDWVCVAHR